MESGDRLFNSGFIALNIFILFAFCNLAVFYSFYNYLETLSVPADFRGILIGLLSVSALIFRPVISPFLTPKNAVSAMAAGLGVTIACLWLYGSAVSLSWLIPLRILHGAGYVLLVSASVTLLVVFMPPAKSGQGFGIVSIMTLLPYAVVPLIFEKGFPGIPQPRIYFYTAQVLLCTALLLIPLKKMVAKRSGTEQALGQRLPKGSVWANLRQVRISLLLFANCLVFSSFSLIFFFLKTFSGQSRIGDAGLFFTVSTLVMIASRLVLGPLFDRFDKAAMIIASLGVFAASLWLLGMVASASQFYGVAAMYGLGVGAATPLLNGLMFVVSKPEYRGLNTNLMLEMVDAGFILGPVAGGLAVAGGVGQLPILMGCAGAAILAALLMIPFIGKNG